MLITVHLLRAMLAGLLIVAVLGGCAADDSGKSGSSKPKASAPPPREIGSRQPGDQKEDQSEKAAKEAAWPLTVADVDGYEQWLKFNRKPVLGRTHGLANIYVNQDRAVIAPDGELKFPFPDGTVIVKELVSTGWVAIMRKDKGADAAHSDWQWIEYRKDGSVAGQDGACWGCHGGAQGTDYVITELEK